MGIVLVKYIDFLFKDEREWMYQGEIHARRRMIVTYTIYLCLLTWFKGHKNLGIMLLYTITF